MIKKIAHIADVHIRKLPTRNEEYDKVFENLRISLESNKPDRIVVVGDLVHDYLDIQTEQIIMVIKFLRMLSSIAPVVITRGNHDYRKKNIKRIDSIEAHLKALNDPNITYYNKTGFYDDDNITWAVWHHGDQKNNPWKTKAGKNIIDNPNHYFTIDLFHDPINGCSSTTGFEMKSKAYYKISDFKGNISMFGDIHRMQFLDKNQTKAYCGSLIAQDVSEGDDNFHGYLLWDVDSKTAKPIPIHNDYSFKNILLSPYTDFDELDFEIQNPTSNMKVRFVWGTLPHTRTKENERKLAMYLKSKYNNLIISHKNEFIESEKIDIKESVTLQNITDKSVQHEIFREYLEKIGVEKDVIDAVILLDDEISSTIEVDNDGGIEWSIIKFGGKNFMSYENIDIDWRDMDGLFQIVGQNTHGKTTIMKLITYILFGKTLETETRMKYGDMRFVNNRNDAKSCNGYLVIEANGEYYGIKKRTEISTTKDGTINGAPTTLSYYILANPDDEMTVDNSLETLDEERRTKTQKKIDAIIGSYDNFMRIVMTTSDTLNRNLSNDMADFIDALLFDSGLDIFDKKLNALKEHQKKVNELSRVVCDVIKTTEQNTLLSQEIIALENEIDEIENIKIPVVQSKLIVGRKYVDDLNKKLYIIDDEIYNLDIDAVKEEIETHKVNIETHVSRKLVINESIVPLKETYDSNKLDELLQKKETHRTSEYNQKIKIKGFEQIVRDEEHKIEIINGDILRLKQDGAKLKAEIVNLKNSKTCPTCGQPMTQTHQEHVDKVVAEKESEMFDIAKKIKTKENVDKKVHQDNIQVQKDEIEAIQKAIKASSIEMETVLKEIGDLTNDKNDVEKRKELQSELDLIPTKIQNEELKITILQQKLDSHDNSLLQIEENKKIEAGILAAKQKLRTLQTEEDELKEDIFIRKNAIGEKSAKIKLNNDTIAAYKEQEYRDMLLNLYKKCVHRDGIPKQMLRNYIIPKINLTLENILNVAPFKVWLDLEDLRPKLAYNNRPTAIIDCISASGKERTFASVVLKFGLNQINVKSKPTIFLLDEVMGKLDPTSVEEFIEILQMIKANMKKLIIIEHNANLNPDYVIDVVADDDGISSLNIV